MILLPVTGWPYSVAFCFAFVVFPSSFIIDLNLIYSGNSSISSPNLRRLVLLASPSLFKKMKVESEIPKSYNHTYNAIADIVLPCCLGKHNHESKLCSNNQAWAKFPLLALYETPAGFPGSVILTTSRKKYQGLRLHSVSTLVIWSLVKLHLPVVLSTE